MGNFTNWQCYTGRVDVSGNYISFDTTSPIPGKMDIMMGNHYDTLCPFIPSFFYVTNTYCRLGRLSDGIDGEFVAIEYEMTVDNNNSFFFLNYAWVLNMHHTHSPNIEQKFILKIKDSVGTVLNIPCSSNVEFLEQDTGDMLCQVSPDTIRGRNWTGGVWANLNSVIGQKIKIYLEMRQNTSCSHWGYVYIMPRCGTMKIDLQFCVGATASRMSAPLGFIKYRWTRKNNSSWFIEGGPEKRVIVEPNTQVGDVYTCEMTSRFGSQCDTVLQVAVKRIEIAPDFRFGVKDVNNNVDLLGHNWQSWYDTCTRMATFVDFSMVNNDTKDSISWEIISPSGTVLTTSPDSLFTYTFPQPIGNQPEKYRIRLTVFTKNGCVDTLKNPQYITIYPIYPITQPQVAIENKNILCVGDSTWLKALVIQSKIVSHQWSWIDKNGRKQTSTGDSIQIYSSGFYMLTSRDSIGCIAKDSIQIQAFNPIFTNSFSNDTLCSGDRTKLVIFTGNATIYEWTSTGNISNIPLSKIGNFSGYIVENKGNTPLTDTIIIIPKYTENGKTCVGEDTFFLITVFPEPTQTTMLQNDTLCDGETTKAINFDGNATIYEWISDKNVSDIPANGTGNFGEYIVTNKTANRIQSVISVTPKYMAGNVECKGKSSDFEVIVRPSTAIDSITVNNNVPFLCEGDKLKIEVIARGEGLVYQWYKDGNALFGEQNKDFIVPVVTQIHNGDYSVEVTGMCGNEKSNSVFVDASGASILVEKWNDVILVDNSKWQYIGYQWYRDGKIISGATNQFYQEIGGLNGCYSVELTLTDGTSIHSCSRCAYKTTKSGITIYPNPTDDKSHINSYELQIEKIEIYDVTSRIVKTYNTLINNIICVSELPNGIYFITFLVKGQKITQKLVKY